MRLRNLSAVWIAVALACATGLASVGITGTVAVEEGAENVHLMATVMMPEALVAAVEAHPGTVVEAELGVEQGFLVYEVEILAEDGAEAEVLVDAGDGSVLLATVEEEEAEEMEPEAEPEDDEEEAEGPDLSGIKVTLAEAVRIAMEMQPGVMLEAALELEDEGVSYYELELVDPEGMEHEFMISAATGELIMEEEEEK